MKIRKVDDKPMVIHTKEKAKIHAHEPKGAKIKGSNIYTVERGPKVHDAKANEMDKKASAKLMLQKSAGGKRTYRRRTIQQSGNTLVLSRISLSSRESVIRITIFLRKSHMPRERRKRRLRKSWMMSVRMTSAFSLWE